jgi:hypothetical protein
MGFEIGSSPENLVGIFCVFFLMLILVWKWGHFTPLVVTGDHLLQYDRIRSYYCVHEFVMLVTSWNLNRLNVR